MFEKWVKWEPVQGLAKKYYAESIISSIDQGLKILLFDAQNENNKVTILFEDSVDAYRCSNETYVYKVIDDLGEKYGSSFYGEWTFFKVEESSYLQSMSEQSYGISDGRELVHYSFIVVDFIIDVVSDYEPMILLE